MKKFFTTVLLLQLCVSSLYALDMQDAKDQAKSFVRGAVPVSAAMIAGYWLGGKAGYERLGVAAGAVTGAVTDHYLLGGKNDKHPIARKAGAVIAMAGMGIKLYDRIIVNEGYDILKKAAIDEKMRLACGQGVSRSYHEQMYARCSDKTIRNLAQYLHDSKKMTIPSNEEWQSSLGGLYRWLPVSINGQRILFPERIGNVVFDVMLSHKLIYMAIKEAERYDAMLSRQ